MSIRQPHTVHRGKLIRKIRQIRSPVIKSKYYYIIAVVRGKRFIASVPGNNRSIEEARRSASPLAHKSEDLRNVLWDVIESPYRDLKHVMATLRHPIWANTGSIEEATQRMRHKL